MAAAASDTPTRMAKRAVSSSSSPEAWPEADRSTVPMNGNGSAHHAPAQETDDQPHENIFLFWPNIIGKPRHAHSIALPRGTQQHVPSCLGEISYSLTT